MALTFLLNPGTRRRKGRRVRRRSGGLFGRKIRRSRSRRSNGRKHKKWGKVSTHRRRVNRGRKRRVARSRRRFNPSRRIRRSRKSSRRRSSRRRRNPVFWLNKGRKRSRRIGRRSRRRNPGLGSLTSSLGSPFSLLPMSFGSGIVGKIAGGIANSLAGGAVFATGFAVSGLAVDMIVGTAAENAADPSTWAKWKRPAAFAGLAGFVGAGVGWLASKLGLKNKGLLIALAAAGPGARAFGGAINALAPDSWKTDTGVLGSFVRNSGALADFMQLSDFLQLSGNSNGGNGALGESESFGLGENESFGDPAGGDMDCGSGGDEMMDAGLDTDGLEADEVGVF